MATPCRALVSAVRPGSSAAGSGFLAGDCLISLNDTPLRDQIDYRFAGADEQVRIVAQRGGEIFTRDVVKEEGEDLGLDFAEATFDGVRRCRNRCLFCFVDRLPRGLRPSLYVKDDDYRYSFLFGSFVTLSNLSEADWERVERQRLSPLYVSVHATNLALRRRLLGNLKAPDILAQLRRLRAARIQVHAQVVLCPGLNDGDELDRTIGDLAALSDCVRSAAVVPVGLTRFGPADGPRQHTPSEMARTARQVGAWQRRFRRELGRTFVYLGDEFYLRTGATPPAARTYDGFPQYENGVGLARVLLDEWSQAKRRLGPVGSVSPHLEVVTGELAAPLLRPIIDHLTTVAGADVRLHTVRNRFFGETVNVAGLLTATDVVGALREQSLTGQLVLPRAMFDSTGVRTLDGHEAADIAAALGLSVRVVASVRQLVCLATGQAIHVQAAA